MVTLHDILSRGYFPEEVPPPFITTPYANSIETPVTSIPSKLKVLETGEASLCVIHNLPRPGSLRRKLSIPNPINFFHLAKIISNNWAEITQHCEQSKISLTTPKPGTLKADSPKERSIIRKSGLNEKPLFRAKGRSTAKYLLTADISQFYPSLYTHSIPWALHGKLTSKSRMHDFSILGNQLDRAIRLGQDRQTLGIPIGPDTSLIAAEILLTAIDIQIQKLGTFNGFRYIDDFEFCFYTFSEAEEFLAILQGLLNEYELQLNPAKTRIEDLPLPIDNTWTSEIRLMNFRSNPRSQHFDLIWFFDRTVELAKRFPKDGVIRYAISRTISTNIDPHNWNLFQELLLETTTSEPGSLKFTIDSLKAHTDIGLTLDSDRVAKVFNNLIRDHSSRGHGNEVAWALWGLILFSLSLEDDSASLCEKIEDPIVALLVLDARSKGLCSKTLAFPKWESIMTGKELVGRSWLLAYEANIKKWLPTGDSVDHVDNNEAFRFFKQSSVYFYNQEAAASYIPRKSVYVPTSEDYS